MLVAKHPESGELVVIASELSSPLMCGTDGTWRRDVPSGEELYAVFETLVDRQSEESAFRAAQQADVALPAGRSRRA